MRTCRCTASFRARCRGRKGITDAILFGSHEYSREELVAEMGAAFLCGHCGIDAATLSESTSYIAGWLRALQNDTRTVVLAAVLAQKVPKRRARRWKRGVFRQPSTTPASAIVKRALTGFQVGAPVLPPASRILMGVG